MGQMNAKLSLLRISVDSNNPLKQVQCYSYSHSADEQVEALRSYMICLRLHHIVSVGARIPTRSV